MDTRDFLFVQSTTEQGGAETVLLNALAASTELREASAVVTLGFGGGGFPDRLRGIGVEVVELPPARLRHPLRAAMLARRIAEVARRRRVRVLVGNGAHPQVFGGVAARLSNAKSAYFVHMIHQPRLFSNHLIDVLAIRGPCDLAISNSNASMSAMRSLRPELRHEVLHPGTPILEVTEAEASAARSELGVRPGELLYGIFGRLQRWKGQDVFIEAAADVSRRFSRGRFVIVGGSVFGLEPAFADELRALAERLGIADRVVFTGQRSDPARLMAACDVICHATRVPEPFGMVIIEAMAQSRPVIATSGGGPTEIVIDGESGILVPPESRTALAEAMLRLASDAPLRGKLAIGARVRVRDQFSSERFAAGLLRTLAHIA